jgi:hypothetical protein
VDTEAIRDACIQALLALGLVVLKPAVRTKTAATALFALIPNFAVSAKAAAPAIFAFVFQLPMRTDTTSSAVFALALNPSVLANALAIALFALVLDSAVLTNLRVMSHLIHSDKRCNVRCSPHNPCTYISTFRGRKQQSRRSPCNGTSTHRAGTAFSWVQWLQC